MHVGVSQLAPDTSYTYNHLSLNCLGHHIHDLGSSIRGSESMWFLLKMRSRPRCEKFSPSNLRDFTIFPCVSGQPIGDGERFDIG
eukprot:scaffold1183_cov114-Cylindrotheca_fusiformis.AAC.8